MFQQGCDRLRAVLQTDKATCANRKLVMETSESIYAHFHFLLCRIGGFRIFTEITPSTSGFV